MRGSVRSSSVRSGSSGHVRFGKRSRSRARIFDRWIGGISQPDQSHSGRSKLGSVGQVRLGSEVRRRLTRKARLGADGHNVDQLIFGSCSSCSRSSGSFGQSKCGKLACSAASTNGRSMSGSSNCHVLASAGLAAPADRWAKSSTSSSMISSIISSIFCPSSNF